MTRVVDLSPGLLDRYANTGGGGGGGGGDGRNGGGGDGSSGVGGSGGRGGVGGSGAKGGGGTGSSEDLLRKFRGFRCKPMALVFSRFDEVLVVPTTRTML